jgi:hypothetical protein
MICKTYATWVYAYDVLTCPLPLYFATIDLITDISMHRQNALTYGAMTQRVVRQIIPTAEARVQSQVSPCGIYGGQSGTGDTYVIRELLLCPAGYHSTEFSIVASIIRRCHDGPACDQAPRDSVSPHPKRKQVPSVSRCKDNVRGNLLFKNPPSELTIKVLMEFR